MEKGTLPIGLTEKIRNRDVIIWAGSGLSIIAGYPSAKMLGEIIKENVEPDKITYFASTELDNIAEEYVQIYSRKSLEKILIDVFNKEPINTDYHKMIADIPQIEKIITTNYDKLFEKVYGDDLVTIVNDFDITKTSDDKFVYLYKIHGCIDTPEKMIITKSDYTKFFTDRQYDLLWNALKVLVSQYSVLFIGYSFEDQNVKYVFEEILKRLGNNHKDYFLISPNIAEHKQQVLKQYAIHYIQMKAEDAIPEIYKAINEHIIEDGIKGRIPILKWQKALDARKIEITPKIEKGVIEIEKIKTKDKSVKVGGSISFKVTETNKEKITDLHDMINGKKITEIKLSKEDEISMKMLYGDSIFIGGEVYKIQEITITPTPKEITAKIILKKSRLSFDSVKGEQYNLGNIGRVKFYAPGFDIILDVQKLDNGLTNISITHKFHINNALQGYQAYSFYNDWLEDDEIQIYTSLTNQPILIPFSEFKPPIETINGIRFLHNLYTAIHEIQRILKIEFKKFDDFTEEEIEDIRVIYSLILEKKALLNSWNIRMNQDQFNEVRKGLGKPSITITYEYVDYQILDKTLRLKKCLVTIIDSYVENIDNILSEFTKDDELVIVPILSKTNQILLSIEDMTVIE